MKLFTGWVLSAGLVIIGCGGWVAITNAGLLAEPVLTPSLAVTLNTAVLLPAIMEVSTWVVFALMFVATGVKVVPPLRL